MRSSHLLPALLAMSLTAAACGGAEQVDSATPSTEQLSTESTTTLSTTTTSPSATTSAGTAELLPLVGGGQIDLNSIEGQDTVLWFWAPW